MNGPDSTGDGLRRSVGPADDPDRYELTELVKSGGEGQLWRGRVPRLPLVGPVAVKILHEHRNRDYRRQQDRWRRQAEVLLSLNHPNLVRVRDRFRGELSPTDGASRVPGRSRFFLIMNWKDGADLGSWVEANPERPLLTVARHLGDIAAALDHIHSGRDTAGVEVIHRDVKPANVIIGHEGACLVDFGLVRIGGEHSDTQGGTPHYLAPECWEKPALYSPASDRYALGATAYFALTGELVSPFDRAHMEACLGGLEARHRASGLTALVMGMLAEHPAERPDSAAAWASDLVATLEADRRVAAGARPSPVTTTSDEVVGADDDGGEVSVAASPANPARKPRRRRAAVALLLLTGLVVVAGAGVLASDTRGQLLCSVYTLPWCADHVETMALSEEELKVEGLAITRTWTLSGRAGTRLKGAIAVRNTSKEPLSRSILEVLPKELLEKASMMRDPTPDRIVREDPVVAFCVQDLPAGAMASFDYSFGVPPRRIERRRLKEWSQRRRDAIVQFQADATAEERRDPCAVVVLESLELEVDRADLTIDETAVMTLSGTMSDGTEAPAELLSQAFFGPENRVVSFPPGNVRKVIARTDGNVAVWARIGSIQSGDVALRVRSLIAVQPQSRGVDEGASASFTVEASPANARYQWFRSGSILAGETASVLTLPKVSMNDNGARFTVRVFGGATSAYSREAVLTVSPQPPGLTVPPKSSTVRIGEDAVFTAEASPEGQGPASLTYQWLKDGRPLEDGDDTLGSRTRTLTLKNVTTKTCGSCEYTLSVSRYGLSVKSDPVTLVIDEAPDEPTTTLP